MAYTLTIPIALGTSKTGLTLKAQLVDTAGADVGSAITTGFVEIGGSYPFTPALTYRNLLSKKDTNITSYYEANKTKGETYLNELLELLQ